MKHLTILMSLCMLFSASGVRADTIGFEAGAGYWHAALDGNVIGSVDLGSELDLDRDAAVYAYAQLEHPIPFIPNFRLAKTQLKEEGQGTLAAATVFEGVGFLSGQAVSSEIDLSHTDATLYYELLDLGVELDLGLTARFIEGELTLNGVAESADIVFPMLYLSTQLDLPFTGTYFSGKVQAASYSGDKIFDADLSIGWRTENFILPEVGVEFGYRKFDIDLDDSVRLDLTADGAYLNAVVRF